MRRLSSLVLVALLLGIGLLPNLGESAMIKRSLEQLSQEADLILLGTVTKQVSEWNNQGTAIHTDVTVAVEEAIKGSPGGEVTFRVAGGIVGDTGMRTSTDPAFQEGEQVVIFLNTAVVPARVAGHLQGKNTVQNGTVIRDGQRESVASFTDAIRAASR
jgi:hypothetical protein